MAQKNAEKRNFYALMMEGTLFHGTCISGRRYGGISFYPYIQWKHAIVRTGQHFADCLIIRSPANDRSLYTQN